MPAKYLMSWDGKQRRWVKMFRGMKYRVFCSELPIGSEHHNKEGSYQTANQWWSNKLAEMTADRLAIETEDYPQLPQLQQRADYARRHGLDDEADTIDAEILSIRDSIPGESTGISREAEAKFRAVEQLSNGDLNNLDPMAVELLFGDGNVWDDRFTREKTIPPERTVGAWVDRWVQDRQEEARQGTRSHDGTAALEVCINKFRQFVGKSSPVEAITADFWERFYRHCSGMVAKRDQADGRRVKTADGTCESWSADTAGKVFGTARSFVKWLYELEALPTIPRNLANKQHRFQKEDKDPAVFRNADLHKLLNGANGIHKLILLLSLNCGMYGKDISDLRKSQIDLDRGRIIRRRSKTRKVKGTPKVSYRLWPETLALLKTHINVDPAQPLAIVTKSGKPWVWTETLPDGRKKKSDNVATIFSNLKKRVGMTGSDRSFKVFRKTSATRLMSSERYRALRFLFLGHKPREVADRHYASVGRRTLDKAILALRKSYKIDGLDLTAGL